MMKIIKLIKICVSIILLITSCVPFQAADIRLRMGAEIGGTSRTVERITGQRDSTTANHPPMIEREQTITGPSRFSLDLLIGDTGQDAPSQPTAAGR